MNVLVVHSAPPVDVPEGRDVGEFDLRDTAANVASALPEATVAAIRGEVDELLQLLDRHRPDVVFNLLEAPLGRPDLESHAVALLEWLGVRFTGCGSETLALCRRKDRVNAVLRDAGITVPRTIDAARPSFPCIVKPADEDGSTGIDEHSVCDTPDALARAATRLGAPIVIQEFVPGREFVVSLWGRDRPDYVSLGETVLANGLRLSTYAAKWKNDTADFVNYTVEYDVDLDPPVREAIIDTARATWRAVDARQMLRVDIRLDALDVPRVLDVNPNPAMAPDVGICRAVQEAGWRWDDFVGKLVEWT
jgi:D-alanine-D-alanine ligase